MLREYLVFGALFYMAAVVIVRIVMDFTRPLPELD